MLCHLSKSGYEAEKQIVFYLKQKFYEDVTDFDEDHVNKIEILMEHCNIKKVIFPLLHEDEKIP